MDGLDDIKRFHESNKLEFDDFLERCACRGRTSDAVELFKYLCCNILASQATWEQAENAVEHLALTSVMFGGSADEIHSGLTDSGYGSPNNKKKAQWLYDARHRLFDKGCEIPIVDYVQTIGFACDHKGAVEVRNVLADRDTQGHIFGLGMKETSHFLRGLGYSHNELAILDGVVLKQLARFGVIERVPKPLTRTDYLEIEDKEKAWAKRLPIPLDTLDLLLWKTGRKWGGC